MKGFAETQTKLLAGKLPRKHVKTRELRGEAVSYIEGWHTIAEANRIFGFDGWDRITLPHQLLHERKGANGHTECAYLARVRIVVRAQAHVVVREGSGFGSASRLDPGEAHDIALKSAETDATKRALATFGNRFGLALYDKDQAGVTKPRGAPPAAASVPEQSLSNGAEQPPATTSALVCDVEGITASPEPSAVAPVPSVAPIAAQNADAMQSALIYIKAVRERIVRVASVGELEECLSSAKAELDRLRKAYPDLRNRRGVHFCDLVASVAELRAQDLARGSDGAQRATALEPLRLRIDKARLALATTKRYRDKDHLKRVAALPCLVCGRGPSQAHHIRFAQDRGLALKVSDEFVVPLCNTDHDALHRSGDERRWWQDKRIDPLPHAEALWRQRGTDVATTDASSANGLSS